MSKKPIDVLLDRVEWTKTEPLADLREAAMPYATHEGVLELFGRKLRCYRLNTGQAVFHADDMNTFLGLSHPGE